MTLQHYASQMENVQLKGEWFIFNNLPITVQEIGASTASLSSNVADLILLFYLENKIIQNYALALHNVTVKAFST